MEELLEIIANMAPEEVLSQITTITQTLLADLDSDTRERFLVNLIGQSEGDKVTGMVHL
ncbi:MAG: hypothetical protein GY799_22835 [Desulfobulbaceae bacterium]|nr:hypothetical protein [Desulfobulbaceae bacterium]